MEHSQQETIHFHFAHKTFTFPKKTLILYTWLNKMFGNGIVGTPKDRLEHNLSDYLDLKPSILKQICIILEHLQNNTENDSSVDKELLDKTEHFLKFGPGCTKGLDVPFECSNCHLQVMDPSQEKTKCIKERIIPHELVVIHSAAKSCCYCGATFPMKTPGICQINDVPHSWR